MQQMLGRCNVLFAGRDKVELLLSVGASRKEALRSVFQRSVIAALTPSLQQMSVLGLVAVPDFMAGQLAAGTTPFQVQQPAFSSPDCMPRWASE